MEAQKSQIEIAISTLIEAAEVAREKGAFTFPQASLINQAILFFSTPQVPVAEPVVETTEPAEPVIPFVKD